MAVVVLFLVLMGLVFKSKVLDRQAPAALQVITTPSAAVFVDDIHMGVTGEVGFINNKIAPGEHSVRLVPESESNKASWEGKINLVPGVMVAIKRVLGPNDAESAGEIVTLEKINSRDQAPLAIVSAPDQAVVKIDGEPRGFAPLVINDLPPDNYEVIFGSPGYQERQVAAKTIIGYKLVIDVQLAREIEGIQEATGSAAVEDDANDKAEPEQSPTPTRADEPEGEDTSLVRIKETPNGWLRVREKPSTDAAELAKVNAGKTFPYLGETENGWYKIEYEEGKEGWVSGVYSELVEEN